MILNAKYTDPNFITPWGPIGYMVFKRTYARRLKEEDKSSPTEEFWQVIERELESSDTQLKVGFTEEEKFEYARLRQSLKFSVAGRFLWQLGTKTVNRLGLPSLQNCAFTVVDDISAFTWAFEMLMLGSGVGYNIQRHNVYKLPKLKRKLKIERVDESDVDFVVPDNREGWVELLRKVLEAHFVTGEGFTYSTIVVRGKGSPIKGFGGVASGPEELCEGINEIHNILNSMSGKQLRPIHCLDIMNIIGSIVVSGNVRRSAQIAIGDYDDIEFLKAKRWDLGGIPNWRAMSNNSIVIPDNFDDLPKEFWDTYENGEAYGLINIELAKKIGRTGETQYAAPTVEGFNPCQPEFATVLTKHGVKQFKDINIGTEIWSKEGWTTVTNKWSTGIKPVSAYDAIYGNAGNANGNRGGGTVTASYKDLNLTSSQGIRSSLRDPVKARLADQILPFDIVLVAANEYGHTTKMVIYGVEFTTESGGMSIDDIVIEKQHAFIARSVSNWMTMDTWNSR